MPLKDADDTSGIYIALAFYGSEISINTSVSLNLNTTS